MARKRISQQDKDMFMLTASFFLGVISSIAATMIYNVATTGKLSLSLPFLSPS